MKASERAYTALRDEILAGTLAPGMLLAEVEQSERLGVSRTPLREALTRLLSDGLVVARGGRGLVVSEVSLERITDLFDVRQALEQRAARLAARRRDPAVFSALHRELSEAAQLLHTDDPTRSAYFDLVSRLDEAIDTATGNPYLVSTLAGVRTHVARVRRLSRDNPQRLRSAALEHLMIVEAILEGSESTAAHATELHLHRSLTHILESTTTTTSTTPSTTT